MSWVCLVYYVLLYMWHIGDDPDMLLLSFLQAQPITYFRLRLLAHFYQVGMDAEGKTI